MITLFPDQQAVLPELRAALRQHSSVILRASCGWGKTIVAAYMAEGVQKAGKRSTFAAHRRELIRQTSNSYTVPHQKMMEGALYNPSSNTYIATANALVTNPELLDVDFLVIDEAHLWANGARAEMINRARDNGTKCILLTATPATGSGRSLSNIADTMVYGPKERDLINSGRLARYIPIAPVRPNLDAYRNSQGKMTDAALDKFVVKDAVRHWKEHAADTRTIGFAPSRERGRQYAAEFNAAGISSVFIDGETPDDQRVNAINAFADGNVKVLMNCQLAREGWDLSAQVGRHVPIQTSLLCSPTDSLPLAIQMMMRCMRSQDGFARIVDMAGIMVNSDGTLNMGFPDDDREWSLEGSVAIKKSQRITPTCTCGDCFAVFRYAPRCPYCSSEREISGRSLPEVALEMEALDPDKIREREEIERKAARIKQGRAKTIDDLKQIAREKGYKMAWVIKMAKIKGIRV